MDVFVRNFILFYVAMFSFQVYQLHVGKAPLPPSPNVVLGRTFSCVLSVGSVGRQGKIEEERVRLTCVQ